MPGDARRCQEMPGDARSPIGVRESMCRWIRPNLMCLDQHFPGPGNGFRPDHLDLVQLDRK